VTVAAVHGALDADGYAVLPGFLVGDEVDAIRVCFEGMRDEGAPTTAQVLYTHGEPAEARPPFERLMTQWMNPHRRAGRSGTGPVLALVDSRISSLGFDLCAFQDVLLSKSSRHEAFPWHQDEPFWPFDGEAGLVIWCALDAIDRSNGGLELARGSHRLGRGPAIDLHTGNAQPGLPVGPVLPTSLEGECPALRPGDAILFCPRTWHRSGRNTSGASRRAWSISWIPPGTVVRPELAPRHPLARHHDREVTRA
jgi:ectoine hydroxylase-related dioxygenase (phytanoyl-CoA dioxygenase family)